MRRSGGELGEGGKGGRGKKRKRNEKIRNRGRRKIIFCVLMGILLARMNRMRMVIERNEVVGRMRRRRKS